MQNSRKITAIILIIVMTVSLFAFPTASFAADEKRAEDFIILAAKRKSDITDVVANTQADSKIVKNSKYSAKWAMDSEDNIRISAIPKDFTPYTELKMTVYASTKITSHIGFYSDNEKTEGSDYFGKVVTFEEGWQELSLEMGDFSKSREALWKNIGYINFSAVGWSQPQVPSGATLYIDSMALSYNENYQTLVTPDPTPTPTPMPEGEAGETRYYEEDFEKTNKVNSKNQKDNLITREEKDSNHYMKITKVGVQDVLTKQALSNVGRYVVFSADYATTKYPASALLINCQSPTGQGKLIKLADTGEIKAGNKTVGQLKDDGKFVNLAVACDFGNFLYDVYIDGKMVAEDLAIGNSLGVPTTFRIFLAASEADAGANLMVDNIKIFDGKTPEDYKNTLSAAEAGDKEFKVTVGKNSPIIDYSTEIIEQLDKMGAVAVNVRSGYIHAKGKKYMPDAIAYIKEGRTLLPVRAVSEALGCKVDWDEAIRTVTINGSAKITIDSTEMTLPDGSGYTLDVPAEITSGRTFIPLRALCEKVLNKKVFWDDRGLIVLSDGEFSAEAKQVTSLNNYMLYDRPSDGELTELFNSVNGNTHPRVIFSQADFDRLINDYNTNEQMKAWGDEVIRVANRKIQGGHESYVIPDGLRLLATCRNTLEKALNISMAYKLNGDEKLKQYLWEEIENVGNFVDWNHKLHYLDTGEMTMAVAVAYDWLYHDWTQEQRKFMEEAIYKHSLVWTQKAMYGLCDYTHSFVTTNTNWNAVCNGGVGVGAIAVFDKYPEICSDILEKNYISLEKMMAEFYPDGAWYEGPGYWNYLMKYLSFFLSTSQTAFGTDFGITKAPGFEKTGQYYLNCDGMTGSNNYHDATVSRLMSNSIMWYSKTMNQPGLTEGMLYKMNRYSSSGDVYAFMYYDTDVKIAETVNMPLDSYFRGTEIASLRSSWTDDNGLYASFHSGENDVNHAHLDAGTFVCDIGGQRFAGDIGSEDYNLDGYFGSNRYKYYRARPEGHNTFVINPDEGYGQDEKATDKFISFVTKPRGGYAITDLTNSYKPYADSAKRGIMLADERRSIIIRDEIRGMKKDENEVYWFMQMEDTDVEVSDKNTVILTKGGVKAKLQIASDANDWEIVVGDAVPLEKSPKMAGQNVNAGWKRLIIKFKTGKDVNINIKLCQLYDPYGDSPITDVALENWSVADGAAVIGEIKIPEFPKAKTISVNGKDLVNFESEKTNMNYVLPYGVEKVENISAELDDNVEISEVVLPDALPGKALLKIRDKNDTRLMTVYEINVRKANEIELEVSGEQDGNPALNCMDGDLSTRWAVEGDSWGIFRFAEPKIISSVWVATWKAAERRLIFDIEVSEDGENFKQVWSGKSSITEDKLEEFKIPEGTYKAVKLVLHGTTAGTWNSLLEVEFK